MSSRADSSASTPQPQQKPIRFIHNEGRPPTKRRRITAACQTCRKRKIRCDGRTPLCSTCEENGHKCLGYKSASKVPSSSVRVQETRDSDEESPVFVAEVTTSNGPWASNTQRPNSSANPNTQAVQHATLPLLVPDVGHSSGYMAGSSGEKSRPHPSIDSRRVPYFRYFGPTAIVPGYKQMVVSVPRHPRQSEASPIAGTFAEAGYRPGNLSASSTGNLETRSVDLPAYDPGADAPVDSLIVQLVSTFFVHLGCNFPFLAKDKFMRSVKDKQAEPILVDSVCGLAARFLEQPLPSSTQNQNTASVNAKNGNIFAQRAKSAVVDCFPCPTISATQACLLLAYESFGAGEDSALWMYLGCAIRMAIDLGLHKVGFTQGRESNEASAKQVSGPTAGVRHTNDVTEDNSSKQLMLEKECANTFWAIFMLDRVISSGTGRPVTLKDDDYELPFPKTIDNTHSAWPAPFPALIQITHLYGRVSDLLNTVRGVRDLPNLKMEEMAIMERDLTKFYEKLDQRLVFNATNFQHYVKAGEGTNFVLLHSWFHTLVMLIHQPMLLHPTGGHAPSLLPNSRELCMSSAKTVADILTFAELIDPKSFVGNPFTCQPIYVAACAFLTESAVHTSHPTHQENNGHGSLALGSSKQRASGDTTVKQPPLAIAANQNYQRCHRGLQQVQSYWTGCKYILTALDQRAEGTWDPETYTVEEMESTKIPALEVPKEWTRKMRQAAGSDSSAFLSRGLINSNPKSPAIDQSQAIGWSLTGTTNSPSSNLTFLYQSMNGYAYQPSPPSGNMVYDPIRQSLPDSTSKAFSPRSVLYDGIDHNRLPVTNPIRQPQPTFHGSMAHPSMSDPDLLIDLQGNSPFAYTQFHPSSMIGQGGRTQTGRNLPAGNMSPRSRSSSHDRFPLTGPELSGFHSDFSGMGDMMIESQDVDISALGNEVPWLEYIPSYGWNEPEVVEGPKPSWMMDLG